MIRFCFVSLLTALLLIACSHSPSQWAMRDNGLGGSGRIEFNGIGGSGKRVILANGIGGSGRTLQQGADANGIGGSGKTLIENGIGGSGQSAILGEVTAFGSIWVNDKHILLPDDTRYLNGDDQAKASDIKLGQVVAVLADVLDEDYSANEVHLLNNAVGPIQKTTKGIKVLGQTILVDDRTRIVNASGQSITESALKTGQWVSVSGFRSPQQAVRATLIQQQEKTVAMLSGPVSQLGTDYKLGDQRLTFQGDLPEFDEPLRMEGRMINNDFIVENWQPLPHTRFFELADEIWLQGFPTHDADLFIDGFEVELPDMHDMQMDDILRIGIDIQNQEFWMQPHDDFFQNQPDQMDWQRMEIQGPDDWHQDQHWQNDQWESEPWDRQGGWEQDPQGGWEQDHWEPDHGHGGGWEEELWYPEEHEWQPPVHEEEWWEEPGDFNDPPPEERDDGEWIIIEG